MQGKSYRKKLVVLFTLIILVAGSFTYYIYKNFEDKSNDLKPQAPSNNSIESGLFKKARNSNILEGYFTSQIKELNLTNMEQLGEKALEDDDYYKISCDDSQSFLSKEVSGSSIFQRYKIKIDKDLSDTSVYKVKWEGKSDRTLEVYGWDYTKSSWILLNYELGRNGDDLTVTADLDTKAMIKDSTANIIIGTAKENKILNGKIPDSKDYDFSLAWLSDTQYYSASYPDIYNKITKNIIENRKDQKIVYAVHTGDLVDNMDDTNQWKNADQSMKVLDKAGIPYGVLAGNHDVGHTAYNYTEFYKYFGEKRFKGKPTFGETPNNNRDHYDLLTAGGRNFVVLYLGWGLDETTYDWANNVLKKYTDRMAIVCTHGYINGRGTYVEQGKEINEKIVAPNKNVFLVLSGHYGGAVVNVKRTNDHQYYEMMANYQFNAEGGAGYYRMLHFDVKNNLIYVDTYSPYKNDYNFYDDKKEEFTIPINAEGGNDVSLNTDLLAF